MRFFQTKIFSQRILKLIRRIVDREVGAHNYPAPIDVQVFALFCNRILIDAESALLLSKKGYYGPAYSLIAISLRNITMYASLLSDRSRFQKFWDEEGDTYQVDSAFKKAFCEGKSAETARKYFETDDAFSPTEFDKLLHGSCFVIRKYYSKKQVTSKGVRYPVVVMGAFHESTKERSIQHLVEGVLIDFLGVFFTGYKEEGRDDLKTEADEYFKIVDEAMKKIQEYTQEYISSEIHRLNLNDQEKK